MKRKKKKVKILTLLWNSGWGGEAERGDLILSRIYEQTIDFILELRIIVFEQHNGYPGHWIFNRINVEKLILSPHDYRLNIDFI